jgi:gas vesicle protein
MKSTVNLEECKTVEEKMIDKLNSTEKVKFDENDDMSLLIKKKLSKTSKNTSSDFKNNYKNYQYDYEEDLYEPRY